jgi:hypothetical protein
LDIVNIPNNKSFTMFDELTKYIGGKVYFHKRLANSGRSVIDEDSVSSMTYPSYVTDMIPVTGGHIL